ncbi:MAG: hypothetical protein U1F43_38990, partial [Myxococcota bacterium]
MTGVPNTGYVATAADRVVVNLPPSASLAVGDTLRVSGAGPGGWRVARAPGQLLRAPFTDGVGSFPVPANAWSALALSGDASRIVAVLASGVVYTSDDFAATLHAGPRCAACITVAASADGQRLAASDVHGGVHISADGGSGWFDAAPLGASGALAVAMSGDGERLFAVGVDDGVLYASDDFGASWEPRVAGGKAPAGFLSVWAAADGEHLVAKGWDTGLYTSPDGGFTWFAALPPSDYRGVASSADGTRIAAVDYQGFISTSSDAGATWSAGSQRAGWLTIASSADGLQLVAGADADALYRSDDGGASWYATSPVGNWLAVASSADGSHLAAVAAN